MTTLNPKDLYQLSVQDENVPPVISSAPGITPAKPVVRKQPPKPLPIKKTRATKKKKKKTGIKQNRSAYNFFVSDFSQDRPGIGLGQFASQASQHYHALSTEQKANYTQLAKQDKLRYEKENTAFVERLQQTCAFEKLFQDINAASVICSFLGVKSLVRTLSCSKKLQTLDLLPWEVAHRQMLFVDYKIQVHMLLHPENGVPPSRDTVLKAHHLYNSACRLIDDEIDQLHKRNPNFHDRLFAYERRQVALLPGANVPLPPFAMLPLCFYIRPRGECLANSNNEQDNVAMTAIDLMKWLLNQHGHMHSFQVWIMNHPESFFVFHDPDHPCRKFHHPKAISFRGCLHYAVQQLSDNVALLDAFRLVAKNTALQYPYARDGLQFVLQHADARVFNRVLAAGEFHSISMANMVYSTTNFDFCQLAEHPPMLTSAASSTSVKVQKNA